jgi:hypothetical protein
MTAPDLGGSGPTVTDHWHELVTVSLLGTDRREPPPAPPGPLADAVADALRDTPSGRMLAHVAVTAVARRAGLRPGAPVPPPLPPAADARPAVPPAAARRWRALVAEWPVLEDEWLLTVERGGWRLPPDVLVGLLRRHRADAARRGRVERLGGPVVAWLLEHQPQLAGAPASPRSARSDDVGIDGLPALAVAPELLALLDAAPRAVAAAVAHGFRGGAYTLAHRNVLANFVARCRTDALAPLAAALRHLDPALATGGIAHSLADLADTRRLMLEELEPG